VPTELTFEAVYIV